MAASGDFSHRSSCSIGRDLCRNARQVYLFWHSPFDRCLQLDWSGISAPASGPNHCGFWGGICIESIWLSSIAFYNMVIHRTKRADPSEFRSFTNYPLARSVAARDRLCENLDPSACWNEYQAALVGMAGPAQSYRIFAPSAGLDRRHLADPESHIITQSAYSPD